MFKYESTYEEMHKHMLCGRRQRVIHFIVEDQSSALIKFYRNSKMRSGLLLLLQFDKMY